MNKTANTWISVATFLGLTVLASSARADTVFLEAEAVRGLNAIGGTVTSPLDIVDWNLASGDSYLEVANGFDSKSSPPTLGQACMSFDVSSSGTYRIWGRVVAPSVEDDSFWVRVNGGSWINWNQIALGSSWHWDTVHDNATPTTPSTFSLSAGTQNLCIAYREDGTKLDMLVVTDDSSFSPTATLTGAPAAPLSMETVSGDGRNVLQWTLSLGATSYTIETQTGVDPPTFSTLVSGVTGHSYFHNTTQGSDVCYRVIAVASTGSSSASPVACGDADFGDQALLTSAGSFTLTSPMAIDQNADGFGAPSGTESLSSVPSSGWARWDFRIAKTVTLKVWLITVAPDGNHDSFWVRVDNGSWVKWNNIVPLEPCGWDDVANSDNGGAIMNYTLSPGSHKIEFAYREGGTFGRRLRITDDLSTNPGGCFD